MTERRAVIAGTGTSPGTARIGTGATARRTRTAATTASGTTTSTTSTAAASSSETTPESIVRRAQQRRDKQNGKSGVFFHGEIFQ